MAVVIIVLVLLQQGRGADAGASFGGGGGSGSMFGSRGPASFLAKLTGGLAALFFLNSISLAYLAADAVRSQSVVEQVTQGADTPLPPPSDVPSVPGSDSVPTAPAGDAQGGTSSQ